MTIIERLKIVAMLCGLMIVVFVADLLTGGYLKSFGIRPREIDSISGIVAAPWLHNGVTHLVGNLLALIVFGSLCLINGVRYFVKSSLLIIIITGLLVWLFARDGNHIGASGWIFGLWSLSIALAWFERSIRNAVIAIAVVVIYGGMVFGVLPTERGVSFESHLFGALAGVFAAAFLARKAKVAVNERPDSELKFWS